MQQKVNRQEDRAQIGEASDNKQWSTRVLKDKIKKQAGFPSELKVANIILNSGWTYISNPYFQEDQTEFEIDFVASIETDSPQILPLLNGGYCTINLVIDVKSYSRPMVVFSSPWTDLEPDSTYGDLTFLHKKVEAVQYVQMLWGLSDYLDIPRAGRSAVIVNDDGSKSKNFDMNQISSAIRLLYKGCNAVRADHFTMWSSFIDNYSDKKKVAFLDIFIPIIIYDGQIFEYFLSDRGHQVRKIKWALLNRSSLTQTDRLLTSPSYICNLKNLSDFLGIVRTWVEELPADSVEHSIKAYFK